MEDGIKGGDEGERTTLGDSEQETGEDTEQAHVDLEPSFLKLGVLLNVSSSWPN